MARTNANWSLRDAKILQERQIRSLMKAAKKSSARDHALLGLCYNAALRVCELIHLRVSDFDFTSGFVKIIPAKRTHSKTIKSGERTVVKERALPAPISYPLPWNVVKLVRRWITKEGLSQNDWIFCGTSSSCHVVGFNCPGGHISKREVQRIYHKISRRADLDRVGRGIHSLKHSRLIEFAKKTLDPWFVRDAGRLASVVTSDVYVRHVKMQATIKAIGGKV